MKLYYAPGACSLAPHIVLREVGADFALEKVDTKTKQTETGADFFAVNPDGYVPALVLDDGKVLTEGAAILQYLADSNPDKGLAPKAGSWARTELHRQLHFIGAELHKSFSPLFAAEKPEGAAREAIVERIGKKLGHFERLFADGRAYVLGESFSVADAYLFTIARWAIGTGIGLDAWPKVKAFVERIGARAGAVEAMSAEGLLQPA